MLLSTIQSLFDDVARVPVIVVESSMLQVVAPHTDHPDGQGGSSWEQEAVQSGPAIEYFDAVPEYVVVEGPQEIDDGDSEHEDLPVPPDANIVDGHHEHSEHGHDALDAQTGGYFEGGGEFVEDWVPELVEQQITLHC